MEVKLFRFTLPDIDPDTGERAVLYLYSICSEEDFLRRQFGDQDPGDMPPELYQRCYEEGKIERITSIDQVPLPTKPVAPLYKNGERDWIPYNSWDLGTEFEMEISTFFDPPDQYL